ASYAAGKAYVRNFTEALAHEVAGHGVRVCCLCPGMTSTEFHQAAQHENLNPLVAMSTMSAERCARIGLASLFSWRRNVVPGLLNKLTALLVRLVPRRFIVVSSDLLMR